MTCGVCGCPLGPVVWCGVCVCVCTYHGVPFVDRHAPRAAVEEDSPHHVGGREERVLRRGRRGTVLVAKQKVYFRTRRRIRLPSTYLGAVIYLHDGI